MKTTNKLAAQKGTWRPLTPDEELGMREWARENWNIDKPVDPMWHPVIKDEISKMLREVAKAEGVK